MGTTDEAPIIADLGVAKKLSHVAQRVASVKPKEPERYYAECAGKGKLVPGSSIPEPQQGRISSMGKDAPRLQALRRRNQRRDLERDDVLEFLRAIVRYKADHGIRFLRWSEVLAVFVGLEYRKTKTGSST